MFSLLIKAIFDRVQNKEKKKKLFVSSLRMLFLIEQRIQIVDIGMCGTVIAITSKAMHTFVSNLSASVILMIMIFTDIFVLQSFSFFLSQLS